mmetsp:Transcript_58726/g.174756  ORF Transcript_58726/g.174756 Transcript_58726/m.174756 type:complete len:375 (-) Transcript_58726:331-1455(-)
MGGSSWGGAKYGGLDINIRVIQGRSLVAKDRSKISGTHKWSDPYVKVVLHRRVIGRTHTAPKTLNPQWHVGDGDCRRVSEFSHKLDSVAAKRMARLGITNPARQVEFRVTDHDTDSDDDPMGVAYVPLPIPPAVPPPLLYEDPEPPETVTERGWFAVRSGPPKSEYYCKNPSGEIEVMISVTAVPSSTNAPSARNVPRSFSLFPKKNPSVGANIPGSNPNVNERTTTKDSLSGKYSGEGEEEQRRVTDNSMSKIGCLVFVLLAAVVGTATAIGLTMTRSKSSGGSGDTKGASDSSSEDIWGIGTVVEPDFSGNVEDVCSEDIMVNKAAYDACDALCEKVLCCFIDPWSKKYYSCSSDERCTPYNQLCNHLPALK